MIYLDNAATTYPKPCGVVAEMMHCMRSYCGNAGRSSHRLAVASAEKIYECRELIAKMFGSSHPEYVCFSLNTTTALNLAIKGNLHEGDHVLISDMEHNAVLRPIAKLASEGKITYDVFPTFVGDGRQSAAHICTGIAHLTKPNTKMLICSHASNICSSHLPLAEIGSYCQKKGIYFIVDAAQSAGHLPIHMESMKINALCVPGHKGLLGPQGCGFVLWGDEPQADTLIEGGSGYFSLETAMPYDSPERFEAGTLPTPSIAGLCEGIREVQRIGLSEIANHEKQLYVRLLDMLSSHHDIHVYAPQHAGSVLLFHVRDIPSERFAAELDRHGCCVRAGFHCSALGHKTLQTTEHGAVRVSTGIYNTRSDIDAFYAAVREIIRI